MWQRVPDKKGGIKIMKQVKVIDNNSNVVMKGGKASAIKVLRDAFINDYNKRLRGV